MKRIEKGMVYILKSGTIIGFDSDEEYSEWLKTPESKEFSLAVVSPKMILDDLRRGSEADEMLDKVFDVINHEYDDISQKLREIFVPE